MNNGGRGMLVETAVEYARSLNARWQSDPGGAILGRPALRWLSYLLIVAAVVMIRADTGIMLSLLALVVGGFGLILFGCSAVLQAVEAGAVRAVATGPVRRPPAVAAAPDHAAH